MSDYRILPIPPELRGPSGEQIQIQVNGVVNRVKLFHGRSDEELDWHVFFYLDPDASRLIDQHLQDNGESVAGEDVANLYCELMVIDDWHRRSVTWPPWQASFQRKYDSADLTRPLRLVKPGSDHAAYELAQPVADEPGSPSKDLSESSRLFLHRGRVYMQGLFVRDIGHSPGSLEIHPPDSIAFAMGEDDRTLFAAEGDCDWPERTVRWRVAWFTNSSHHRVADEAPLQQQRTTTWYLSLPGPVRDPNLSPETLPLEQAEITTVPIRLWDSKSDEWYDSRGVSTIEDARVSVDPRDNRRRLRVSATMNVPRGRGGLIVRDYVVRMRQGGILTNQ